MVSIDIQIEEFVWACSSYDIKELIKVLVENEHLPKGLINEKGEVRTELGRKTNNEIDFMDKLDKLKEKYYSLTQEEELSLKSIFDRHL